MYNYKHPYRRAVYYGLQVTQVGPGGPVYQTAPVDYTTQAWIACLCCFWPTGLLAILKANEVGDLGG